LSDVLLASAGCVQNVLAGRSLSDSLPAVGHELRPAAQAISFHCMRRLGLAREVRRIMVRRAPGNALADALSMVALALLDTALEYSGPGRDTPPARPDLPVYAVHTVVDQAVGAMSCQKKTQPYKGLLNAMLRRFVRERSTILAQARQSTEALWNYPQWWVRTLRKYYPWHWEGMLGAGDRPGPMTLRVNARRATADQLLGRFEEAGLRAHAVSRHTIILDSPRPVQSVPGFDQGLWSVQDASAQKAAVLLDPQPGMRVLDACAAPGGKTAHLLERADIDLLALDVDQARLARVEGNLRRLGLLSDRVALQCADAASLSSWWDGVAFDAVLADVPCTASGVVRRHPDIRWLRQGTDVGATAALQKTIADALWRVVKPGGRLLYATCSVFPQEGEIQAQRFLRRHGDAVRQPGGGQILPSAADDAGASGVGGNDACGGADAGDGFFYALFVKRGEGQ
jgi:16S rRNA (cytosine967-C5)-methyltransferase